MGEIPDWTAVVTAVATAVGAAVILVGGFFYLETNPGLEGADGPVSISSDILRLSEPTVT